MNQSSKLISSRISSFIGHMSNAEHVSSIPSFRRDKKQLFLVNSTRQIDFKIPINFV